MAWTLEFTYLWTPLYSLYHLRRLSTQPLAFGQEPVDFAWPRLALTWCATGTNDYRLHVETVSIVCSTLARTCLELATSLHYWNDSACNFSRMTWTSLKFSSIWFVFSPLHLDLFFHQYYLYVHFVCCFLTRICIAFIFLRLVLINPCVCCRLTFLVDRFWFVVRIVGVDLVAGCRTAESIRQEVDRYRKPVFIQPGSFLLCAFVTFG